jgi:hypothetical protein
MLLEDRSKDAQEDSDAGHIRRPFEIAVCDVRGQRTAEESVEETADGSRKKHQTEPPFSHNKSMI